MKYKCSVRRSIFCCLLLCCAFSVRGQVVPAVQANGSRISSIRTAVPFLLINPDARTGAMAEAGVALSPDGNASAINPAKSAFLENRYGFALSYSPWLKNIASDVNLGYLSAFYKIDARSAVSTSLRYFSFGAVQLTDINQQDLGTFSPNEVAADITYARRFGDVFSLGTTLRYVSSNISSNLFSPGQGAGGGKSFGVDVSGYFCQPTYLLGYDAILAAGINISNIGPGMSYTDAANDDFLPANLKIGGAATLLLDELNEITLALDVNRLLVPTLPLYAADNSIIAGRNPDRSLTSTIFGSFTDAPGGAAEEFKEISIASGLEYWYDHKFALRAGYFYENPQKGNRRYLTFGTGIRYGTLELNLSYLAANTRKSPLANTLRFTLLLNVGELTNE